MSIAELGWEESRVEEALVAIARHAGLPHPTRRPAQGASIEVDRVAHRLGLEAEPVDAALQDLAALVSRAAPALVSLADGGARRWVGLLGASRRRATILGPDGAKHVPVEELVSALGASLEAPFVASVEAMLDRAKIPKDRRSNAKAGLLRERVGAQRCKGVWLLRLPTSAPFAQQFRAAGLMGHVAVNLFAHVAQYGLAMAAWVTIGSAALKGHVDRGWLWAWALLVLTLIPLRLLEVMAQGRVAIGGASILKRRLLAGALRLEPEEMRGEGAGQLLGRTLEASAVESLALSRGVSSISSSVDLAVAATVLGFGAAPGWQLVALALWLAVTVWLVRRYYARRRRWTDDRLHLTHELVERMVGHRTRIAQQSSDDWYDADDHDLAHYFDRSRALDRASVALTALVPAAWLLVGFATLAPAVIGGSASPASLAVSVGGVLLAFRALRQIASGSRDIATVMVAWKRVSLLFESGAREEPIPTTAPMAERGAKRAEPSDHAVLSAQGVVFRYRATGEPVLRGCDLRIGARDRVILEGPSGGGKSTLALVLAGIRVPESGTLLVDGLDRHTTGLVEWRKRVVAVPQFHENHVISGTFAFNILMARAWPPAAADMREAMEVCRELGLGELLERMPAGLQQVVGETGWQLSHGERSRMYIARALLQAPELMVLDESFAALDPETMQRALGCVIRRASALVVVAHP